MYGLINSCFKSLVVDRYGEEAWLKLRREAGVPDTFLTHEVYEDEITMRMASAASRLFGVSEEALWKQYGQHFFEFSKGLGYDYMLRALGGNLIEFTENLDTLHNHLSLSYKDMKAPSFRVERNPDGTLLLHYYSDRKGVCYIVPGLFSAIGRDYFNSEITLEVVEQMEELERTGKKEHVVFLVREQPAADRCSVEKLNPTLRHTHCDLSQKGAGFSGHSGRWETIRSLDHLGKGEPRRDFEPVYPGTFNVDAKTFCHIFPFHVIFDEQLLVRQAGVNFQRIVPGLQTTNIHLDQYFRIVHPGVTFAISSIRKFKNSYFVLQARQDVMPEGWKDRPVLQLRGQMIWMASTECMLYQASPLLRSLQELEEREMHISDIAQHDVTRDLILLNHQLLAEMELSNQLERKKEELHKLSQHLEEEKKKTETLLYAMLPERVANELKDGKSVEAGEFKECTVLFSDVVTFTSICAECEPIQIVQMLNSMYLRFDRLTTVHNVYKVETIGDAYMVVGGVPIPVASHAERVANFALGMTLASRDVINPVTGESIQIRVGLHSGPVLAGVVGEKMPRYCLFGDTVNTAARMESHSLPNKIHLSPTVYEILKNTHFVMRKRGEIEIKGKGLMTTYFLDKNAGVSDHQILGLVDSRGPEESQMSSGKAPQGQRNDEAQLIPLQYDDERPSPQKPDTQVCPSPKPKNSGSSGNMCTEEPSQDRLELTTELFGPEPRNVGRSEGDSGERRVITASEETNTVPQSQSCLIL